MIVSRFSEPYDTIDGAEPQQRRNIPPVIETGRSDRRWEDDGGPAAGAAPRIVAADADATKPTWSMQSLRDLLSAIRASKALATDAAEQEDAETEKANALQAEADRRAEADRIRRDRYRNYRNLWEHS